MEENYTVSIEPFAHKHFIKSFEKKYRSAWDVTLRAIIGQFERIDMLLKKDVAETIVDSTSVKIIKSKFSVAGTKKSPNASGNRCILAMHEEYKRVSILLVYHKNDLGGGAETANWKRLIKEHYPEYRHLL
ncbi:MAG: hypothetical protein CO029_01560 [Candidatus Magasanikbacteria bacterium CG_4_9_14_0_2_um_filter_41_10]|uniref:Addiction module toxin RelE n=1 Tax=Candidatus Magasanikbacteria bacterium CG_4_10_14_0_2_um_filter_41_31 TaxID=1974639 RepID=A0A2M7V1M1_9BACT|nr:MAG: hypothetical protein AUJ37_01685 [Candidatus Magasanikbacteria bacterium CG1_02_41_34]PIZ92207.1 MAG: hypothetical protein COX83_04915 [Candidatus Magasanikbacteria bacterium CG_4_10_14_0_2_um_filter_41_31]PJC53670.1 MAG: hypothetical protein CO029_01560 [Candidatus Magasanikbacteria bacterium CG_4_9_14_0_2_um_filter_41_10]